MAESLYDVLGVAKDADADTIRKTYRKLARKHHPDVNPGDKAAEESFKRISAAYEVLSDDKKKAAYDEFGEESMAGGFDPDKARAYREWKDTRQERQTRFDDQGPIDFDFGELFGRARGPMRGHDLHATVRMELRQAVEGAEVSLDLPQGPTRVRIPPGADTGATIRLSGKGSPGGRGGPAGDLVIEIEVLPHPVLRRDGLDLAIDVPVTLDEAYNGGNIDVPTFDGTVSVKVPPRSQNGARLRLRGKGIKRKDSRGDLYVVLAVRMPDKDDDRLAEALKAGADAYSAPVRQELRL